MLPSNRGVTGWGRRPEGTYIWLHNPANLSLPQTNHPFDKLQWWQKSHIREMRSVLIFTDICDISMGRSEGIFYKKREVEWEIQRNLLLYTEMINDRVLPWFFFCTSVWSSVCMLSCSDDVLLQSFISQLN